MPTNKELLQKNKTLREENEKLKKENEKLKLKEQIEKLKKHYQFLQDTDSSDDDDELIEDLEDYKLFCDAFDVPCAMEAIHNHWRNLTDECKEKLTKKGLNPK